MDPKVFFDRLERENPEHAEAWTIYQDGIRAEHVLIRRKLRTLTWPCEGEDATYCADADECGHCLLAQEAARLLSVMVGDER